MRSTAANENDRTPIINLCKTLTEKLYADKEYIGKALTKELKDSGIDILTTVPNNMRAKVISAFDKAVLSKRYIIETIDDSLEKHHKLSIIDTVTRVVLCLMSFQA